MADNTNDKNRKQPNQKPEQDQDQRERQPQKQSQQPQREGEIGSAHEKQSNYSGQSGSNVGKRSMNDEDVAEEDVRDEDDEEDGRITQRTPSQSEREDGSAQKPMPTKK